MQFYRYLVALVVDATPYAWAARVCAVMVLISSLWFLSAALLYPRGAQLLHPYIVGSFFIVGLILLCAAFQGRFLPGEVTVPVYVPSELLFGFKFGLSVILFSAALWMGVHMGIEGLPGRPSPLAIGGFILISLLGHFRYKSDWRLFLGGLVILLGALALLGHLLALPALYYVVGASQGMTGTAGILFVLSGGCYVLMTRHWIVKEA